ncbi:MAG: sodium:solute symporter [Planctomycetes bacterium]|nr:sodium:solute symporter [Planctomycetota bacterium]
MDDYGIWSLLPPVLAIVLAILTRQVLVSLLVGIWVGYTVVHDGNPLLGAIASSRACVDVFADAGNTCVILFSAMVGALIALIQRSGGVNGFVSLAQNTGFVRGRRSAGLLALTVSLLVFVESSITCLVTGAVARPIFDKLRMSREKLAYVCDTGSAPVCILIPLNGWGAFVLAQLAASGVVADPLAVLVRAIPLNFYALASLLLLGFIIVSGRDFGPMRRAERRAHDEGKLLRDGAQPMISEEVLALPPAPETTPRAWNMILPLAVMVAMVPVGLVYTGLSNLAPETPRTFWAILGACSGSTSIFWAVATAVIFAGLLYRVQGIMKLREFMEVAIKGVAALVPLAALMVLAFAIGHLCRAELHTGTYVASLVGDNLATWMVAPIMFVVSCAIAFATGTSFGTFAIMLAIALQMQASLGGNQALVVAAVLGGGVFGDHCSPISDTTIVSSMASASDHIDHVRTQLPYALTAGLVALVFYTIGGLVL